MWQDFAQESATQSICWRLVLVHKSFVTGPQWDKYGNLEGSYRYFYSILTHGLETQAGMHHVSKCDFTSQFCIEVYSDDSATMRGNYFTHRMQISVLLISWRKTFFKKQKTKIALLNYALRHRKIELCKCNV